MFPETADNLGVQEHDVDAIIANAYGGHENPTQHQQAPEAKPEPTPEPQYKEFEFNVRGQPIKIKENDPRFSQWLSQGHDYAQNVAAMKAERESFDRSRGEWEKSWNPYKEIDQFAKQNPDWWSHIEQSYQQKLSTPDGVPDPIRQYLDQRLDPLAKDIPLVKQFLQKAQTEEMEKQRSEEDSKLDQAIKFIQSEHPDIDFKAKDPNGLTLEQRILKHAQDRHLPDFESAFLSYYHKDLYKIAESRGKEAIMQEMKKRQKLGLLDDVPAPGKGTSNPSLARKPQSWNDPSLSAQSILKEFNFS